MRDRRAIVWAAGLVLALGLRATAADPAAEDEHTLAAAHVAADGPALVEFFRKHTPRSAEREHIRALIADLGDDSYEVRERASAELAAVGPAAAPLLRAATKGPDVEVVRRAEKCLRLVEPYPSAAVAAAAARLLAMHRPPGAVASLLGYVPFAEDDTVADAVRSALVTLARHDGRPDPGVVHALDDRLPARRAVAVAALIRSAPEGERRPLLRFLRDPEPAVRLEAALALADAGVREAVRVLVDLLADLPPGQAWRAEDVLVRLAGNDTPAAALGTDAAGRRRCRDAWHDWWVKHGDRADLSRLRKGRELLGYTLLVEMNRGLAGRVVELDAAGKPRWQIENLQFPVDAEVVGDDRVLVAEYRAGRVTERDFKGGVRWEKRIGGQVLGVQRLPNGGTFVVTRNRLLEVDHAGREVASVVRPSLDVIAARKLRTGELLVVTTAGLCLRLDAEGKELARFAAGAVYVVGFNVDVLPNGHVLVPQANAGRVVEFDRDGHPVWEAEVDSPSCVCRLPNGNTLVGSMNNQRAVELDRSGKEVWEHRAEGRLVRVRRR